MVGIECDDAAFEYYFKKVHTRNSSFKKKIFFLSFANNVANWTIVDILNYAITGNLLATHFG